MKKLALCVGINKYGHGNDLSECVPDAKGWSVAAVDTARTLTGQSFEVVTLVDQSMDNRLERGLFRHGP